MWQKIRKFLPWIIFSIFVCLFFSYRLLEVPMGLTADETAFGYNAVLLSRTGHDENGRFLPFFVLSNHGTDWKQPVTQYYLTLLFKIFNPSLFLLRFSSIIIILISSILLFKLCQKIFDTKYAVVSLVLFLTIPLIMIQGHMGLDNIMPIPFTIIWIFCLYQYNKNKKIKFLVVSALALGVNFYTYKGMRAIFPIWYLISLLYIYKKPFSKNIRQFFIFSLVSLPFILVSPVLNHVYPGSILGGTSPKIESFYDFLYPYFSSFDPTFLFIKGDDLLFHSTGHHGFFLLASLPLFLIGIYHSLQKNKFSRFILTIFFISPILYGMVNSVHRASRLMCLIPFYVIICLYGLEKINQLKLKYRFIIFFFLISTFTLNYCDFLHYYYFDYAKLTQNFVGDLKYYLSFKALKDNSEKLKLNPYIADDLNYPFYESIYFPQGTVEHISQDLSSPPGSILLTNRDNIPGMSKLDINLRYYYLQVNKSLNK
ncbi:MAG: glycosyltransferase family 39 protein [Candidatus Shapirobacteria bacterium]|nr:glycosyltransferase family 39 protein [Candidatus Shapirobacteria bacterium]